MKRNTRKWSVWIGLFLFLLITASSAWLFWSPGKAIADGRHDLKTNGIWIQHGWLGDDGWFTRTRKDPALFRDIEKIRNLKALLLDHHITDLYPHLCPATPRGMIPGVDPKQTELFLSVMKGFRVMPWVGGVLGKQVFPESPSWRRNFIGSIQNMLRTYPGLAGVHLNIEPLPSGNQDLLTLLIELRRSLPTGKILSMAAYPPPTLWHPYSEVHWKRPYFEEVAWQVDQMVVMMYDTAIPFEKIYRYLMASWTKEILSWAGKTKVLLGAPAYEDAGVGYHDPKVENLKNALMGIHAALKSFPALPKNYQGIAIYCEWEMNEFKWSYLRKNFLRIE